MAASAISKVGVSNVKCFLLLDWFLGVLVATTCTIYMEFQMKYNVKKTFET